MAVMIDRPGTDAPETLEESFQIVHALINDLRERLDRLERWTIPPARPSTEGLSHTPPPLGSDTPASGLKYLLARVDALERQVRDLSEWLEELADDFLDCQGVA